MAAPTLTSSTSSDYTDNAAVSEVTGTLTWNSGDRILVVAMTEDQAFTLATPTATGLTFSALGSAVTPSNSCWLHAWEATAAGSGSSAVTATRSGGTGVAMRGIYAFAYGTCTGFARTNKAGVNGTETVSVTRTGANSAIVFWSADWSASGTGGIGWTPAGQTQLITQTNTGATAVVGRWDDQGATGTTAYGTTGLAGTAFTVSAVEVLGTVSSATNANAGEASGTGAAQTPTTAVTVGATEATAAGVAFGATVSSSGSPAAGEATAAGVAHDPTVSTSGGGTQSLFTSQTPAGSFSDGAPGIATATTVRFAQAGEVSAVAFYASSSVSGTYTAALYSVDASDPGTGTLLGSATMGSPPTPSAWNTVPITPVPVTAGVPYRAVIFSGDGRYVTTSSFFSSDLVNGDITADANGDTVGGLTIFQGTYRIDAALGYPNSAGGGSCYFVDVVFSTTAAGSPDAGEAPATGAAHGPTAAITAEGAEATATGAGHAPVAAAGANTATATATGVAQTPAVGATVTAGTPTAAGTAEWDAGSSISLDLVADNPVTAAGVAFDPTVSTASAVSANAADAAAAGVAQDPAVALGVNTATAAATGTALGATVTTSSSASAPAGEATGAGTAQTPSAAVIVEAGAAAAVGQALDPTVSTFAGTAASAGEAAASGTADSPAVAVVAFAGAAEAAGAAADPSVLIGGPGSALAGEATATGAAHSPRVRKQIPRPYSGVVTRPYSGVVLRP